MNTISLFVLFENLNVRIVMFGLIAILFTFDNCNQIAYQVGASVNDAHTTEKRVMIPNMRKFQTGDFN